MCLIIATKNPKQLSSALMETAYENNSDGFGLMFVHKGQLHTRKIVPKTFNDIEKLWDKYKSMDVPMGIHFRFATNGDTNKSMSHPFEVLSKAKGDDRDLWVMHNGPQLPTPMIDNNKSDTHQFVKWVLRPQLSANPNLLYNAEWQEMIEELIGTDKLLFLDSKTKEFVIFNEDHGTDMDKVGWLSNTYSIQPTSYGKRDKYYDDKTDTIKDVSDSSKWCYEDDDWGYGSYGNSYGNITRHHYGHYNRNGVEIKPTPLASGVGVQNKQLDLPLPKQDADETMWNGKALRMEELYQMDKDEIIELCEENPVGMGCLVSEEIVGNRA